MQDAAETRGLFYHFTKGPDGRPMLRQFYSEPGTPVEEIVKAALLIGIDPDTVAALAGSSVTKAASKDLMEPSASSAEKHADALLTDDKPARAVVTAISRRLP